MSELCSTPATELARRLAGREVSAVEVMKAHLARIHDVNPGLNAIVTLLPEERLLAEAEKADRAVAAGDPLGPLHGLPVAHKDLTLTRGIRTTFGSPIFADFVPEEDALIVERLHAAGAITIGKTNTPEFGAGSQTFNPVFGPTRNPWDPSKTCGGSSGGAAVALATGMVPIADGSDYGGSLRNPASFCGVVGLRPSPGRVPVWPNETPWYPVPVQGPMARSACRRRAHAERHRGARTRGRRFRCRIRARTSGSRSIGTSPASGWHGARTSAGSPSTRASRRRSPRRAAPSKRLAARWRMPTRT